MSWPIHAVYSTTSNIGRAHFGAECAPATPTANTSTPSQGAQSPSRCPPTVSTVDDGTPTASTPARMPNASSASCTAPATKRLAPETI